MMKKDNAVNAPAYIGTAIFINFVLFLVKLYVGLTSSSICIYSDAINNMTDTLACALALAGSIIMKKGATDEYPNGYKKAEHLVGFVMAALIAVTGGYFSYSALERLLYPRPVNFLVKHAFLLSVTIAVKLATGVVFKKAADKSGSVMLKTVYIDSFADSGVTAMTLMSFIMSNFSFVRIDAVFGLIISVIIIVNAVKLLKSSAQTLMGRTDPEIKRRVEKLLNENSFNIKEINVFDSPDGTVVTVTADGGENKKETANKARENLGIKLYFNQEA
ncbi:MAG: cation diffusion facilitator family transporter [Oscillospiraceae bacterium]|nr:cation diffusion facilitator family transporter [Oscillospiraceae bacterium]